MKETRKDKFVTATSFIAVASLLILLLQLIYIIRTNPVNKGALFLKKDQGKNNQTSLP